ncbi:hypothetical protein SAMN05428949_0663 [Chitinophaga sp. YR627]|uniref:hypothetical protein n=1 Tax=Chitinophaga sp. YR627 TaxID=1881041 RepID=UPI0008EB1913|nr:hypothetical protein [Chitinophaga sp. YR627]SFM75087.1 hypothetical protein SAMN05428949_0663 [Chitinophaga sp. YR627]
MAKTYEQLYSELTKTEEGKHKLTVIHNALLGGTLDNFDQLFAIIPKSTIQILLGTSFYAFPKKVASPGTFTLEEIDFLASLFKVDFDVMIAFFRKAQKSKSKRKA